MLLLRSIPFFILLTMVATGPRLYEKFWHRHHDKIVLLLAALVIGYYILVLQDFSQPITAIIEYIQFISLIAALYVASGGIFMQINLPVGPMVNVGILLLGVLLSNLIGTTGASMLLIRPYMNLNRPNIQPYHIIFFIFLVSNIGGALTPIGDPPLFLGFLSGVPFFWTIKHHFLPWAMAIGLLLSIFYLIDRRTPHVTAQQIDRRTPHVTAQQIDRRTPYVTAQQKKHFTLLGKRNLIWLLLIIMLVFVDPRIYSFVPAFYYKGHRFSYVREVLLLLIALLSYRYSNQNSIKSNAFSFAPLREVAVLFIGIFSTMIPTLELIRMLASSKEGHEFINSNTLYWGTGICSSFLDNAPTYLNFLAAGMAKKGLDVHKLQEVQHFVMNEFEYLQAVGVASVFFGAMTYIGNGPNFMVKAIAVHNKVHMPSFFGYIFRFSLPILLPILILVWWIFFYLFSGYSLLN